MIDEAQVGFVDQSGGLQRVIGALTLQVIARQLAQLLVDERHEAIGCIGVALVPIDKNLRDFLTRRGGDHVELVRVGCHFTDAGRRIRQPRVQAQFQTPGCTRAQILWPLLPMSAALTQ